MVVGASEWPDGFVPGMGVALVSGPGSDLSEEPAFRMQTGRAGFSVVPRCPAGPTLVQLVAAMTLLASTLFGGGGW